jgi:hypothetical protein
MPDDLDWLDPPPTEAERAEAEALRRDLDSVTSKSSAEAELAASLRAAWEPRDLGPREHAAMAQRAVGRMRRSGVGLRVTAMLALAASVVLAIARPAGQAIQGMEPPAAPAVAISRSTQPLFGGAFAPTGGESARIDRIAVARAADLRENEFQRWGVP